jgi:septum formation protein
VTTTVGGYMVEGASITLFAKLEGDWFSILGLPLLPLLGFLRQHGAIAQ